MSKSISEQFRLKLNDNSKREVVVNATNYSGHSLSITPTDDKYFSVEELEDVANRLLEIVGKLKIDKDFC